MAKETKDIKHYRLYTLYANVVVVVGKKDGKEVTRTDREPFALFDDKDLLDAYTKNSEYKLKGQTSWEVGADWIDYEPTADRFGLPLNPAPNAPQEAEKASNEENHNGDN